MDSRFPPQERRLEMAVGPPQERRLSLPKGRAVPTDPPQERRLVHGSTGHWRGLAHPNAMTWPPGSKGTLGSGHGALRATETAAGCRRLFRSLKPVSLVQTSCQDNCACSAIQLS